MMIPLEFLLEATTGPVEVLDPFVFALVEASAEVSGFCAREQLGFSLHWHLAWRYPLVSCSMPSAVRIGTMVRP